MQSTQVAIIDASGVVAVHTGSECSPEAGHTAGEHYACQANIMLKRSVWPAMAKAFEESDGDLAHRLLAADQPELQVMVDELKSN
jgi:uncharacterized Ntn-hydrolase superfamily protein